MDLLRLAGAALALSAAASPAPSPGVAFVHPDFARLAAHDPALIVDSRASTASGLRAYRTTGGGPEVAGFLEPSEGIVGHCGDLEMAAVPLDSGTPAGIAGWLVFITAQRRHVAIVHATSSLAFTGDHLRAASYLYQRHPSAAPLYRVDSIACKGLKLRTVNSLVTPNL